MRGKKLILETSEEGCLIPTSHKLNIDGYLRIRDPRYSGKGRAPLIMNHRLVWEEVNGAIPEGFEIDHICRNRACCNIGHLQMLSISDHKVKTNKERYSDRHASARKFWEESGCTGTGLSEISGVSVSCACRWIRDWKKSNLTK